MARISYKTFLMNKFKSIKQRNFRYSLRAFARDLGLSPSRLSELLNGKTGISSDRAREIAQKLKLTEEETNLFLDLIAAKFSKRNDIKDSANERLVKVKYENLTGDIFSVISDWQHLAILELTHLNDFKSDAKWIANKLGISEDSVKESIERLLRCKLLSISKKGEFMDKNKYASTSNDVPSLAVRNFHKQVLEKAISSIDEQDMSKRHNGSWFVAISEKDIPFIKKKMDIFLDSLGNELNKRHGRDKLYAMSLSLFDLEKK